MIRLLAGGVLALGIVVPAAAMPSDREVAFYKCDDGREIDVRYQNRKDPPKAVIVLDGVAYTLGRDESGSGARYTSLKTATKSEGLQWWTKGNEATLARLVMNEDKSAGTFKVETTCKLSR